MKVRKEVWYVVAIVVIIALMMVSFWDSIGFSPRETKKSNTLGTASKGTSSSSSALRDAVINGFNLNSADQSGKSADIAALTEILKKVGTDSYYDKSGVAKSGVVVTEGGS